MKITIDMNYEHMKIDLEYDDYSYSEQWYEDEDGSFRTKGKCIASQIEEDETIDDFGDWLFEAIELLDFCELWEKYRI